MKLNRFELKLLSGKLRCWVQEYYDIRQWRKLGARPCVNGSALDIGCGQGNGIKLAMSKFGVATVDAFDIDDRMLDISRRATAHLEGVKITNNSATEIAAPSDTYDIVFDYQGAVFRPPSASHCRLAVCVKRSPPSDEAQRTIDDSRKFARFNRKLLDRKAHESPSLESLYGFSIATPVARHRICPE